MPVFSDLNLGFFNQHQDILYDEDALRQQVLLRLSTERRTRVKRRNFSAGLEAKLFEPVDATTAEGIRQELITIIGDDGRIVIRSSEVIADRSNQRFYVSFSLYCPALRKEFDLTYNLLSKAG
jgi:phage baseplate assembly protein W